MKTNCNHNWQQFKTNKLKCSKCNALKFKLFELDEDNYYIIKDNGMKYKVRKSRKKYIYPNDWKRFINILRTDEHKLIFDVLIKTGARIEEALLIKRNDLVDDRRKSLKLRVTKTKAIKGEKEGEPRTFQIDSALYNKLKRKNEGFIFLNIDNNTDTRNAKKTAKKKGDSLRQLMNRKLKLLGIENISFQNIRKTHGMYLKTLEIKEGEICNRLGHDYNTFLKHYSSPSIFDAKDKREMIKIIGNIYGLS